MPDLGNSQEIDLRSIVDRVERLLRLDVSVFDEVRDDPGQTLSALVVVAVATLLAAIGGWIWLIVEVDSLSTGKILLKELGGGVILSLGLWAVWVVVTHALLTTLFDQRVPRAALLRTMGYAAAPAGLTALMLIPVVSFGIGLAALIAWFVLSNLAIQSTAPAAPANQVLLTNTAGFLVFALVLSVLADVEGLAPGVFVHAADLTVYLAGT